MAKRIFTDESLATFVEEIKSYTDISVEDLSSQVAFIDAEDNEDVTNPDVSTSDIIIDTTLSTTSTNPVQNKVVTNKLNALSEQIDDLTGALRTFFTNIQVLIPQLVFNTENHIAQTIIQNAEEIVNSLDSTDNGSDEPIEPLPQDGIIQNGSVLSITSGVTVTQIGTVLEIA